MKIYLIKTKKEEAEVGYDEYDGHVIVANTEQEARALCPNGDEGKATWDSSEYSTCEELGETTKFNEPSVLLSSYNAG